MAFQRRPLRLPPQPEFELDWQRSLGFSPFQVGQQGGPSILERFGQQPFDPFATPTAPVAPVTPSPGVSTGPGPGRVTWGDRGAGIAEAFAHRGGRAPGSLAEAISRVGSNIGAGLVYARENKQAEYDAQIRAAEEAKEEERKRTLQERQDLLFEQQQEDRQRREEERAAEQAEQQAAIERRQDEADHLLALRAAEGPVAPVDRLQVDRVRAGEQDLFKIQENQIKMEEAQERADARAELDRLKLANSQRKGSVKEHSSGAFWEVTRGDGTSYLVNKSAQGKAKAPKLWEPSATELLKIEKEAEEVVLDAAFAKHRQLVESGALGEIDTPEKKARLIKSFWDTYNPEGQAEAVEAEKQRLIDGVLAERQRIRQSQLEKHVGNTSAAAAVLGDTSGPSNGTAPASKDGLDKLKAKEIAYLSKLAASEEDWLEAAVANKRTAPGGSDTPEALAYQEIRIEVEALVGNLRGAGMQPSEAEAAATKLAAASEAERARVLELYNAAGSKEEAAALIRQWLAPGF